MLGGSHCLRWLALAPLIYIACILASCCTARITPSEPAPGQARHEWARERARTLWHHGYDNYIALAYPADELRPISCAPRGQDLRDPFNQPINDICGDYLLTAVDSVDTLYLLGEHDAFRQAVEDIVRDENFDVDATVQVFEATIRVLGGLLSAHTLALREAWYDGGLLPLADDLGRRLVVAFDSDTGIPRPRVSLRWGILDADLSARHTETCAAGAGSLILEFATLSHYTGNDTYRKLALDASLAVWDRRNEIGLPANTLNSVYGGWMSSYTSLGAGVDSFYEYAFKGWLVTGDDRLHDIWNASYNALMDFVVDDTGHVPRVVNFRNGVLMMHYVDSLTAFFPGLLVTAGRLDEAIVMHHLHWSLWQKYRALPERFDFLRQDLDLPWYPVRPEFAESTYFLYRATRDPFYLAVGQQILDDLESRTLTECGFAGLTNVATGELEDRMESFVLSETLKYLFLLFDLDNPIHDDEELVFSTEGHPLPVLPYGRNATAHDAVCEAPPAIEPFSGAVSHQRAYTANPIVGAKLNISVTDAELRALMYAWGVVPHPHATSIRSLPRDEFDIFFGSMQTALDTGIDIVRRGSELVVSKLQGLRIRFSRRRHAAAAATLQTASIAPGGRDQAVCSSAAESDGMLRASKLGLNINLKTDDHVTIADPAFDSFVSHGVLNREPLYRLLHHDSPTPPRSDAERRRAEIAAEASQMRSYLAVNPAIDGRPLPTEDDELAIVSLLDDPHEADRLGCRCPAAWRWAELYPPATAAAPKGAPTGGPTDASAGAREGVDANASLAVVVLRGECTFYDKALSFATLPPPPSSSSSSSSLAVAVEGGLQRVRLVVVIDPPSPTSAAGAEAEQAPETNGVRSDQDGSPKPRLKSHTGADSAAAAAAGVEQQQQQVAEEDDSVVPQLIDDSGSLAEEEMPSLVLVTARALAEVPLLHTRARAERSAAISERQGAAPQGDAAGDRIEAVGWERFFRTPGYLRLLGPAPRPRHETEIKTEPDTDDESAKDAHGTAAREEGATPMQRLVVHGDVVQNVFIPRRRTA